MLASCFSEDEADEHCRLRRRLLSVDSELPPPAVGFPAAADGFLEAGADRLLHNLREYGLAVVHLDEPLTHDQFVALGALLGEAIPETDDAVQPYVEDGIVLNLVADAGRTQDVSLQPFATGPLSLHSEGSGRSAADQPRYIVLMCEEPGSGESAATVLVPMAAVADRLSAEDAVLLAATRYEGRPGVPTVARREDGRTVYSFRDFQRDPLHWVCDAPEAHPDTVNRAIRRLLAGMYAPRQAYGVPWTRGLLVVIDNTWFFHGRTAGAVGPVGRPRHLKRLRIR
ncbi:alpha-ketoglutarate-dependent taurine dioxygenase [Streptomyces sp. TLI_235]|nr:alpha-ketoglutarate-dependent taurine dioxygenase [Streptomyces sp. TLI_235]